MKFRCVENTRVDERIFFGTHESGLKIYVIPKKEFSKSYAIYGTEYGSLHREFIPLGDTEKVVLPDGVAHFLEHKLFEEEDGTDAFNRFAETGASANAFTSFNITAYLFTCTDRFYDNLDILLDFVNKPYFTEKNIAKEQGIIGQEIKMYEDDPNWRVYFNALTAMYHNNPVKIDIAGSVESIAKITPELLYKCTDTFYNPSNMRLVCVGDVEPEKVAEFVDKHIPKDRVSGEVVKFEVAEPKERVQEYIEQKLSVSSPIFNIAFKETETGVCGEELLKREIETDILLEVLFGNSSSAYSEMYEKGIIDGSFEVDCEFEKEYGFTLIGGESKVPKEVYEKVLSVIKDAKEKGIDEKAVKRAKKLLIGDNLRKFNNVEAVGVEFIKDFMKNINYLDYTETVEKITMEDIMNRLNTHFDTENAVLSVVKPLEEE
ncbi:MAG: insulinase family protein [Clostridia bacterium]|nr:insulinase family protein [Clostridia bacterium]